MQSPALAGTWLCTEPRRALDGAAREQRRGAGGAYFIARCAAHVVQRREGWLPRSGLQYGADLVLYRNHPSLVHSDHCVVFGRGSAAGCGGGNGDRHAVDGDDDDEPAGLRRWTEVQAVSRLCVQVNKGLVTATASVPGDGRVETGLRSRDAR